MNEIGNFIIKVFGIFCFIFILFTQPWIILIVIIIEIYLRKTKKHNITQNKGDLKNADKN